MEENMKLSINKTFVFIGTIFFLVGVVVIGIGISMQVSLNSFKKTAKEADGRITRIETSSSRSNGKNKTSHTVYVEYNVDDTLYNGVLNYYSSNMYEGKPITILYDPNNPGEFRSDGNVASYICYGVGALFGTIGFVFLFYVIRTAVKQKKLFKNGRHVVGTVTDVKEQLNVKINGRHPLIVECKVEDINTGETMLFASTGQNNNAFHSSIGMPVDIYYDPQNPKKNFVDVSTLLSRIEMGTYNNGIKVHDYR